MEETLAVVNHLWWPPHCFLASQSDGRRWCSHLASCPAQPRCYRPHFDVPSLRHPCQIALPAKPVFSAASVGSGAKGSLACVGLCRACAKMKRVISSGEREKERGKRNHVTWVCHVPSRKTEHLCDDRRAAGK